MADQDVVLSAVGSNSDVPAITKRPETLFMEASAFIQLFCDERYISPEGAAERLDEIRREIMTTGTYMQTPAELSFAARVAWRNSARCIGRAGWRALRVRDRRHITSSSAVAAECFEHLREATNGGRIRPVITVFAPDSPGHPGPRIISSQVVRYAGYEQPNGSVIGDPLNVAVTRLAMDLGWCPPRLRGKFDILPLIVADDDGPDLFDLPPGVILEVALYHPVYRWFSELGLKWYAVPMLTDMHLDAGGIRYPAAPFNGWYMCTEITRDLGDVDRYNVLPQIAAAMSLAVTRDRTLWKDRAQVELTMAVLSSFDRARVKITDHHTESKHFLAHVAREERAGRHCPTDWSWIVPPQAGSTMGVFHRYYDPPDAKARPAFIPNEEYRH